MATYIHIHITTYTHIHNCPLIFKGDYLEHSLDTKYSSPFYIIRYSICVSPMQPPLYFKSHL